MQVDAAQRRQFQKPFSPKSAQKRTPVSGRAATPRSSQGTRGLWPIPACPPGRRFLRKTHPRESQTIDVGGPGDDRVGSRNPPNQWWRNPTMRAAQEPLWFPSRENTPATALRKSCYVCLTYCIRSTNDTGKHEHRLATKILSCFITPNSLARGIYCRDGQIQGDNRF